MLLAILGIQNLIETYAKILLRKKNVNNNLNDLEFIAAWQSHRKAGNDNRAHQLLCLSPISPGVVLVK